MKQNRYIMCDQVRGQVKSIMRSRPERHRRSVRTRTRSYLSNIEYQCIDLIAHGLLRLRRGMARAPQPKPISALHT